METPGVISVPGSTSHLWLIIIRLDAGTRKRPGNHLCRSADLSTHSSPSPLPSPEVWATVPTNPPMSEIYFHLISRSTSCGVCSTVNSPQHQIPLKGSDCTVP
ncbi:hypothetical protein PBY51_022188 [Eleginops maclovinus]|uniref:Uncharacterized protein n=1 Tax=Eleginops maclovinus TaxID=56733 RepID=A0AAN8AMS6_ELEMC|nr:hypothetical protein PBY51_022188 [Eleginops maclovinus]